MKVIVKRQLGFLGRVMRRHGFESLYLTGKIEGTPGGGRKNKVFGLNSVCNLMQARMSPLELVKYTQNRALW